MNSVHEQMRKCEECGEFFFVPMIQSHSRGVYQVRQSGPWVCGGPHPSAGEKRRMERRMEQTTLGIIFDSGHRRVS
jgi:hypothetical protein